MTIDIEAFRQDFMNDVQLKVAIDGGFTSTALTAVAAERLEEAGEVSNFELCTYRSTNGGSGLDGYAFDAADDSLRVFITHRSSAESLETITKTEAKSDFKKLVAFLDSVYNGRFEKHIDDNHPARDFAETLYERKTSISRIRVYLITNCILSERVRDWPEGNINNVPVEYHIWDIGRFYRAFISTTGFDELLVNFSDETRRGIPCMLASTASSPYAAYLCVIPASVLAEVYDLYGSRILEGNVRSFLTAKGKINKGIRQTLIERPEMFFAYNNGISAVASSVDVEASPDGPVLVSAVDFQIVNGGQTTASIANANRADRDARLSETFVPMKLSVVSGEQSTQMIADISRYANSQNKVTDADFFANHPFHQRIEKISRRVLAPARDGAQYETRWYYERARGQYLNEFISLTPAQREKAKLETPKSQLITKTDLAKSELSWKELPYKVSLGAQSFFSEFASRIDDLWKADPDKFNEEYFKNAVARIIVYRSAEQLVSKQPWYYGGYRSIIVTYTLAKLHHEITKRNCGVIDLRGVWRNQAIDLNLEAQIASIAEAVFASLSDLPAAQLNLTQWAKRQACWEQIKQLKVDLIPEFLRTLVNPAELVAESRAAKQLQQVDSGIDEQAAVLDLGFPFWLSMFEWAEGQGQLAPSDRAALKVAAGLLGGIPTDKQAKRLLQIKARLEAAGFVLHKASVQDISTPARG